MNEEPETGYEDYDFGELLNTLEFYKRQLEDHTEQHRLLSDQVDHYTKICKSDKNELHDVLRELHNRIGV